MILILVGFCATDRFHEACFQSYMGRNSDPHRDPHRLAVSGFAAYCQLMPHGYNEMRGKNQRAPERKLLPFRCSACLRDLSNLRHEAAHFLRGLLLHLPCGVGVGAEREARVVVPEHTADDILKQIRN